MWQVKSWAELTPAEIYAILDLRVSTFVVEQQRIYHEIDQNDLKALHVFLRRDNQVLAYARIFLTATDQVTFGRVVIVKQARGEGLGAELLTQIMDIIKKHFPGKTVEIESQAQVQGFYKRVGFQAVGAEFIFESTPHIKMIHPGM